MKLEENIEMEGWNWRIQGGRELEVADTGRERVGSGGTGRERVGSRGYREGESWR